MMEIRSDALIAVVGAGTMGAGISQVAATAGHPVVILDRDPTALERGAAGLAASLDSAVRKGRLDAAQRDAVLARIRWSADLADAAEAALTIEAIVENLEIKRSLFTTLAGLVGEEALLASNTSSLGIAAIAEPLARRGRFLGVHFFNPVPAMKLVELVAGPETDAAAIDAVAALMTAWGKVPVRVSDVAGFIVNRVARPYYGEGFIAFGEGLDPTLIDAALVEAGGFRMGPLALGDLIGHDINYAVASSVFAAGVGVARFRPQEAQRALVERGTLGRKTGSGIYDYRAALPAPTYAEAGTPPAEIRVGDAGLLAPLVESARAAGIIVVADPSLPAETLVAGDLRIALGDGRRLAGRDDADVLIDHARDFTIAKTLAITVDDRAAAATVAGLLAAAGRQTLLLPDRPGQLVLRTLAQLANGAGDTITGGIASDTDVDAAMRFGANHPEGPLAWVGRVGAPRVRAILANLAASAGDDLYAPSPWFSRA